MNEADAPSPRGKWRHRLAVLKFVAGGIFNPTFRLGLSAIVRFHGYCAVTMAVLCFMGAVLGKAPFGNAVGAVIFAIAALLLLRSGRIIRPSEPIA